MLSVIAATGTSSVAIGVAVVATLVVVALLAALVSLVRATRQLRRSAEDLRRRSEALLGELGGTLVHAAAELERVDDLVGSAESLTETLGSASQAAYLGLASPLIKVMALRRGATRAAERWRGRDGRRSRDRGVPAVPSRGR